jgi:hypothetical protein
MFTYRMPADRAPYTLVRPRDLRRTPRRTRVLQPGIRTGSQATLGHLLRRSRESACVWGHRTAGIMCMCMCISCSICCVRMHAVRIRSTSPALLRGTQYQRYPVLSLVHVLVIVTSSPDEGLPIFSCLQVYGISKIPFPDEELAPPLHRLSPRTNI